MSDRKYGSFSEYQESRKGGAVTEEAVREFIVGKAGEDDGFGKALIADPATVVEAEIGIALPAGLKFTVHEETDDELHMVLPAPVQLTAAQMQSVTGGWPPAVPGSTTNDDALYDNDGGQDYDGAVTEEAVRGYIVGKAAQDDAFRKTLISRIRSRSSRTRSGSSSRPTSSSRFMRRPTTSFTWCFPRPSSSRRRSWSR